MGNIARACEEATVDMLAEMYRVAVKPEIDKTPTYPRAEALEKASKKNVVSVSWTKRDVRLVLTPTLTLVPAVSVVPESE